MTIPARFAAPCAFCREPVDIRRLGTYRFESGWAPIRTAAGGTSSLALREPSDRYACKPCIESQKRLRRSSSTWTQPELFDA